MNKYLKINLVSLIVLSLVYCQGQTPTEKPEEAENKAQDIDPYFVETNATVSPLGPKSITRNILQDKNGHLWFATWEGIIGYNGSLFTNYTKTKNLRNYHVFAVAEDKAGNLWFGTIGAGVYRFDGNTFTNFTTNEGLVNNRISCFYIEDSGKIWIGTEGGISIFDGKSFQNITTEEGLCSNDVNAIIEDKSGKLWIGTRGDACVYDGKTFTTLHNPDGRAFVNVRTILGDSKGNIWLGGNDGLWRYDGSTFTNFSKSFTGYIYEDKKGNIWSSSESPENRFDWVLSRYDKSAMEDDHSVATELLKEENMFFGIYEDKNGSIWLGNLRGVYRYDRTSFNAFRE